MKSKSKRSQLCFLFLTRRHLSSRTLKLEKELGEDGRSVFIKIHAPFETLCHIEEEIRLVLPLKVARHLSALIVSPLTKSPTPPWSPRFGIGS